MKTPNKHKFCSVQTGESGSETGGGCVWKKEGGVVEGRCIKSSWRQTEVKLTGSSETDEDNQQGGVKRRHRKCKTLRQGRLSVLGTY